MPRCITIVNAQPGRVNHARALFELLNFFRCVECPKRFEVLIFQFGVGPFYRNGLIRHQLEDIVDDGTMPCDAHVDGSVGFSLDPNGVALLRARLIVTVIEKQRTVAGRWSLSIEVHVVVEQHGHAPGFITITPDHSERHAGQVVAVHLKFR